MTFTGSFRMTGLDDKLKYMWQYRKHVDIHGPYLQHVIRPLFKTNNGTKYWEFITRGKKPNKTITLENGESICIESLEKKNENLECVIIWSQTTNGLWCSIKNTKLGKILTSIENTQNINSNMLNIDKENIDKSIDEAVLFCHKIANGLQILQDKLANEEHVNSKDFFPKGENIQRKNIYIGTQNMF